MMDSELIKRALYSHGYDYIETIGSGASSKVYLCKSDKYHQIFAIKEVFNNILKASEYSALTSLHHPYIINLYEAFEFNNSEFLVMEYCPNDTLRHKRKLGYDKFIYYAKQILEALSYCHANKIAHRDIKPDNIFLDNYDRIKLADFGLSKFFDQNITSSEKCGSLMYCSPEMLQRIPFNPFQADIWALGITFFYMATGNFPFPANSCDELIQIIKFGHIDFLNIEIDPNIKMLIQKMTSKNPKLRPTVDEILKMSIFNQIKAKKFTKTITPTQIGPRCKYIKNKNLIMPFSSFAVDSAAITSSNPPARRLKTSRSMFTQSCVYKSSQSDSYIPQGVMKE